MISEPSKIINEENGEIVVTIPISEHESTPIYHPTVVSNENSYKEEPPENELHDMPSSEAVKTIPLDDADNQEAEVEQIEKHEENLMTKENKPKVVEETPKVEEKPVEPIQETVKEPVIETPKEEIIEEAPVIEAPIIEAPLTDEPLRAHYPTTLGFHKAYTTWIAKEEANTPVTQGMITDMFKAFKDEVENKTFHKKQYEKENPETLA